MENRLAAAPARSAVKRVVLVRRDAGFSPIAFDLMILTAGVIKIAVALHVVSVRPAISENGPGNPPFLLNIIVPADFANELPPAAHTNQVLVLRPQNFLRLRQIRDQRRRRRDD